MKRTLIGVFIGLAVVSPPLVTAQSTFLFRNYDGGGPAPVYVRIFDAAAIPLAGPSYLAELYGGSTPDSLTPLLALGTSSRTIKPFATGNYAGYVVNAVPYFDTMVVNTVVPGDSAWLQMRAWDATLGATYEEAAAKAIGGYGESLTFHADGGDPTRLPAESPGRLIGLESFSLREAPEPSGALLLLFGGAFAWRFARRKPVTMRNHNLSPL